MSVLEIDSHKLQYHPERICDWLQNGSCNPLHIEMGITNRCNHNCVFCTLNWVNHGNIDFNTNVVLKTIEDAGKMGVKSIYFAGEGEPTIHKDLSLFIQRCKDLNIKTALSSNGSLLTESLSEKILPNLSWIRISLDAFSGETHAKIHGVKTTELQKIYNNIENMVKIKRKQNLDVQIGIQCVMIPENVAEIENLCKKVKELGVDNFQVKPAHSHPKSSFVSTFYQSSQQELHKKLEKLNSENFKVVVRLKSIERLTTPRNYKICEGFHFYCLIDAKGNVVPCNIFYDNEDYIIGNLYKYSLEEIWNSKKRMDVIKKIEKNNFCMCGEYRCRLDVMNRYLNRVKNPEINDEFI